MVRIPRRSSPSVTCAAWPDRTWACPMVLMGERFGWPVPASRSETSPGRLWNPDSSGSERPEVPPVQQFDEAVNGLQGGNVLCGYDDDLDRPR